MYYSQIRKLDVSNGCGIRTTLFVSGCTLNCEGCFNKDAQSFTNGELWTKEVENEFIEYTNNSHVVGVNLLGGEVFQQDLDIILNLVKRIKDETKKPIWVWSGYLFDDIIKDSKKYEILQYIDVLVDGRFILAQRDLSLKYRGSSNQRIIDVKESLKQDKVVLYQTK